MVVDIVGNDLYVHWICVPTDDPEEQTKQIVQPFEPLLKRIFE
jgi:multicomponent Na+:H+ antiporter subunit E